MYFGNQEKTLDPILKLNFNKLWGVHGYFLNFQVQKIFEGKPIRQN